MIEAEALALTAELAKLADSGLNWVAFVEASRGGVLPERPSSRAHGMLLLLSLGRSFADQTDFAPACSAHPFDAERSDHPFDAERSDHPFEAERSDHPFDERASSIGDAFVSRYFGVALDRVPRIYPGAESVNLRHWLEVGRVQFRSQMGLGIRPDCGTWLAVRLAYWVELSVAQRELLRSVYPPLGTRSPCDDCAERPCIAGCPANAITRRGTQLNACATHRLKPSSSCAERCLARDACPVGREYAYSDHQRAYHYSVSLRTLRRWSERGDL